MNNKINYIPQIDGLRAIAVLLVVFYHLKIPFFSGGFLGVDIFFVISGFLITKIYLQENTKKSFSLYNFFSKRFKRLFPALLVVLVISIIISYFILSPLDYINLSKSAISSLFFVSNIYYWTQSNYFNQINEFKPLVHTWSLGIEMSFYIFIPLLLIFLKKLNKISIFFIIIIFLLFTTIITYLFIQKGPIIESKLFGSFFYGKYVSDSLFYLIPFRFYEFLFGISLCFLPKKNFSEFLKKVFFTFGIVLIIFSLIIIKPNLEFQLIYTIPCLLGTSIIIYFKDAKYVSLILKNRIAVFLGLISYSLYLIHWPIITLYKYFKVENLIIHEKIIIFIISIILSYFSLRIIEKPFRSQLTPIKKKFLVILSLIFVVFSFLIITKNGFTNRLNVDQKKFILDQKNVYQPCKKVFSLFGDIGEKICLQGNEVDLDIVMLGDSNNMMWFEPFKNLAKGKKLNVAAYKNICNVFPNKSIKDCKEIKTNSEILVIGHTWYRYQDKTSLDTQAKKWIKNINDIKFNNNFKNIKKILIFGQIPFLKSDNLNYRSCFLKPYKFSDYKKCNSFYEKQFANKKFFNETILLNNLIQSYS